MKGDVEQLGEKSTNEEDIMEGMPSSLEDLVTYSSQDFSIIKSYIFNCEFDLKF